MKKKEIELDVNFIGGQEALAAIEEKHYKIHTEKFFFGCEVFSHVESFMISATQVVSTTCPLFFSNFLFFIYCCGSSILGKNKNSVLLLMNKYSAIHINGNHINCFYKRTILHFDN